MAGRPLEEAKRSAAYIIDKMREQDRVAIVAYDDRVDVILPSQKVTDKIRIKAALEYIRSGGATDLHNGWLTGAEEVARNKSLTQTACYFYQMEMQTEAKYLPLTFKINAGNWLKGIIQPMVLASPLMKNS